MSSDAARTVLAVGLLAATGCGGGAAGLDSAQVLDAGWDEIAAAADASTVTWAMWMGDPSINDYVTEWVAPELERRHGIRLRTVSAQGNEIVAMLMTELEADRPTSEIDLVWINGETFYQLRQIDALLGPFTHVLPNARFIDFDNPFIRFDFQQEIDGYECPWGNVQLALIHDAERVPDPPRTPAALAEWIHAHPGRFTWDATFTGLTFLKSLLIHFAGGPGALDGPFDETRYTDATARLWDWVLDVRPSLWKGGETFPPTLSQMHQLFAAGELDFTMSNNDAEVDAKVLQGLFPESARAFVLDSGTIQNSHYLGIPRRASNVAGALAVIDTLISPEAQYEKLKPDVWGDGTVLDIDRLPAPWPDRFRAVPRRERAPSRESIAALALKEPASEYMIRLHRDFRRVIIEAR